MAEAEADAEATVWKEATLSFSHTVTPWDSVWTDRLDTGLPTYLITGDTAHMGKTTILWTGIYQKKDTIHLRTLHETYQHLPPWDGTTVHAVFLLAELLQYKHIYDPGHLLGHSPILTYTPPRPLILVTDYERESYTRNSLNPLIDTILLSSEPCTTIPSYLVFARPGIVLDDWRDLWNIPMEKRILVLSPYDIPSSGNLEECDLDPVSDGEVLWVMRSEDVRSATQSTSIPTFIDYSVKEGFLRSNPSRSLIAWRLSVSPIPSAGISLSAPTAIRSLRREVGEERVVANCFQTSRGLAFDSSTYFSSPEEEEPSLLPTVSYPLGTVVPFVQENPLLFTISKLLLNCQGVYTCPETYLPLYRRFGLTNTIPPSPNHIHFVSALVYPADMRIRPEMIHALRKAVSWTPDIDYTDRPTLICEDATFEEVLRRAWTVRIIDPTDSFDRILANLSGAWGILGSTILKYCWMLPRGARVFDLSSPQHAEHAKLSELKYIPTTKDEFLTTLHDTD
jgi:hypothetical protein